LYTDPECRDWERRKEAVIEKIRNALFNIRQEFFEVPFINFYRKEYVQPELKIDDLWRVYFFDEEWCKLQARKKNLRKLYEQCQTFQGNMMAFTKIITRL
jgi:transcription elongation factor SPT6